MSLKRLMFAACVLTLAFFQGVRSAPQLIDYQGFLKNNLGAPVTASLSMGFTIYTASTGGSSKWSETQNSVSVSGGLFNVTLGSVAPLHDSVFNQGDRWLEISIGGSALSPRSRIVSAAYSERVQTVDGAGGGIISSDLSVPKILIGAGNTASGNYAYAAGYGGTASGNYSGIGGGYSNTASGTYSFVTGHSNQAREHSSVLGGYSNTSWGEYNTIGGGSTNYTNLTAATVGGGQYDTAWGIYTSVVGGKNNRAKYDYAAVGGGRDNLADAYSSTVGGGAGNSSTSNGATVGGGISNLASGGSSAVPGGNSNAARGYGSLAAGTLAKANHDCSMVLASNSSAGTDPSDSVRSGGRSQIVLRADSGIVIMQGGGAATYDPSRLINTTTGAYLSVGGTWTNASDSTLKENLRIVSGTRLLEELLRLPVYRWNYRNEGSEVNHIGPMAQDFYRIFEVGDDERTISTVDPAGIALAAIQELYQMQKKLEARSIELSILQKEISEIRLMVQALAAASSKSAEQVDSKRLDEESVLSVSGTPVTAQGR